jgi:hypothetical protein
MAEKLTIDVWHYATRDGRGPRKALDWLLPFAAGEKKWTYRQISGWQPEKLAPLLASAGARFHDPKYLALFKKLTHGSPDGREYLLYPLTE